MTKLKPRAKSFFIQFKGLAESVAEGAATLGQITDNSVDSADKVRRLVTLAEAADANHDAVLDSLHASFITPFDPEQIQALADALSTAMRHIEGAGTLIHRLAPPPLPHEFKLITTAIDQCAAATVHAVEKLSKLKGLRTYRKEILRLAYEAELARRDLLVTVTSGVYEPLQALKLRAVQEELGRVVTAFRAAADVVESVIIAES